jgi:hypothetical protein
MAKRNVSQRRQFLRASAATVWGGSCLAFGLAGARAEAAVSGRPVFTEASFNQMMREAQASGQIKQMAAEASRDLKGWLQGNFTLTPGQVQQIQAMSPAMVREISQTIAPIAQKGGTIQLSIVETRRAEVQARTEKMQKEAQKLQAEAERLAKEAKDSGFFEKIIGVASRAAGEAAEKRASLTLPAVRQPLQQTPLQQPATRQPLQQQRPALEPKTR